jgi:predicted RNA-binding Zn-ribbon protein involved in translation (DUF1610 family)
MGQSKRMDKPRCSKCRSHTIPVKVHSTCEHSYVTLKCPNETCGHLYVSHSESAFRLAVAYKLTSYNYEERIRIEKQSKIKS